MPSAVDTSTRELVRLAVEVLHAAPVPTVTADDAYPVTTEVRPGSLPPSTPVELAAWRRFAVMARCAQRMERAARSAREALDELADNVRLARMLSEESGPTTTTHADRITSARSVLRSLASVALRHAPPERSRHMQT